VSRIVNTESTGNERTQLVRAIIVCVRQLSRLETFDDEARDLAAFVVLALHKLSEGVDASAAAWEKRGYWVKADRFRMEWAWAEPQAESLQKAIESSDAAAVVSLLLKVADHFKQVRIASNPRVGRPWIGAFARMTAR
jgi:hypothetical protein